MASERDRTEPADQGGRDRRMYELIKDAPKTGESPTIWAFPQVVEFMKVAGQPVSGPWPPHQRARPDPDDESMPVAIVEPDRPKPFGPLHASPKEL
jgi:hypothetical protein